MFLDGGERTGVQRLDVPFWFSPLPIRLRDHICLQFIPRELYKK
jgi:hypothetical protein